MKLCRTSLVLLLIAGPFAGSVEAQSTPNPWRECGIGAAIFSDNPTAAAISNVIWDSGTTAITSATSTPDICSGAAVRAAQFIHQTYPALAMETAVGQGDHVMALLELAGCEAAAMGDLLGELRKGFSQVVEREDYTSATYADRAFWYYDLFVKVTEASHRCAVVI